MKYLEEGDFMDLIRMKGVSKRYKNGVTAIYDLDLNIKKGEFVFIIGSTGCGKSTLIKMLYREEKPNAGKISIKQQIIFNYQYQMWIVLCRRIRHIEIL